MSLTTDYAEQPSVHDVMALKSVHDVVALNTYQIEYRTEVQEILVINIMEVDDDAKRIF